MLLLEEERQLVKGQLHLHFYFGYRCTNWDYMLTLHIPIDMSLWNKHTGLIFSICCKKSLTFHLVEDEKLIVLRIQAFMCSINKSCHHVPFPFSRPFTSSQTEQPSP